MRSALYESTVMHHRVRPFRHRFTYRVFSLLLDVDEIDDLGRRLRLFSRNRFNLLSFRDRDFGPGDGTPPRRWVEAVLADRGYDFPVGRIDLLCFPRLFGYVFNPLSVYYVRDTAGVLRAILYEVTNTYRDRHSYLLPVGDGDATVRHACDKRLYVSPFIGMEARYHFRMAEPGAALSVAIREEAPDGNVLFAAMTGVRRPLTDGVLVRMLARHPLMTLKVIGGIHWEAFRLWRKGARVFRHPAPPEARVSGDTVVRGYDEPLHAAGR
ncbi:MAG: DUF1365 family protein [Alphaproteobacteria bacterium]|nr:DUF1365 family protein [Alphaproteobacteria bacterium]